MNNAHKIINAVMNILLDKNQKCINHYIFFAVK